MNLTAVQWTLLARTDKAGWFSVLTLEDQAECVDLWSMNLLDLKLRGGRAGYTITGKASEVIAALERRHLQP